MKNRLPVPMPEATTIQPDPAQELRGRRLVQISGAAIAGIGVALVAYVMAHEWIVAALLAGGLGTMLLCQYLGRKGRVELANVLLLLSMTAMASALMWLGEGLRDSSLLLYPMILIIAGMLVPLRGYLALLTAMLAYLLVLTGATEMGPLRMDSAPEPYWEYLRDSALILSVSGFAVWLIVNDLQRAIVRLQVEIDKSHASQQHLTYLSQHDTLTGLPNRTLGREHMEQAIALAARQKSRVALLFVDMDNFKAINDSLGHAAGDEFLKQVATRLTHAVRKSDIVARQGGDEFVVGLTHVADVQAVSTAASTVLACVTQSFTVRDAEITTSCSIGIALYPDDGVDYEALLRSADIAMYQAKASGRNVSRFFDEAMNARIQQNLILVAQLRTAIARKQFVLHYQPVVDLRSGALRGAEALVRWQHPQRGLVGPGDFIPTAEHTGLIVDIGEWVLQEACRQMVQWRSQVGADFVMAVNLSTVQFHRRDVEEVVARALQQSGLPAQCLELEITESTLIDDAEAFTVTLQRLKALGVRIAIDDFGTGYSNLAYLQRFAVDKLKIDQSFVRRLNQGPQERAIVSAIIQMARSLNLLTTAEGIEDEATRQTLIALDCVQGQGYHFAKPQPAAEFFKGLPTERA